MTAIAVIALILLLIYVVIGSIRQRKLLFNKTVLVVAIIAIGILVLQGQFSRDDPQRVEVPKYQQLAPPVQDAPYVLQTSSRAYYVATYKDTAEALILTSYYFYDKKKWELSDIPLPLDKSIYGELKPVRRNIGG